MVSNNKIIVKNYVLEPDKFCINSFIIKNIDKVSISIFVIYLGSIYKRNFLINNNLFITNI